MKVPGVNDAVVQKDLAFPVEEFQRRLKKVREEMAARGLELLVVSTPENIYYMSGYHTVGYFSSQFLLIPISGDPVHITRGIEETNVKVLSWIDQSFSYMDHELPIELLASTIRKMGYADAVIGVEMISWFLSIVDYERLREMLGSAKFQDGSFTVEASRVVKSDLELDYIRQAARIAEVGMEMGISQIHAGANENDIAAEIQRAVTGMGSEYPGLPVFVSSGVRTSQAHATWAGRKVQEGDPVLLEISGCVHRYSAALMRFILVKPVNSEMERMEDVSRKALEKMINAIRPGRPLGEVWNVWSTAVTEGGYEGRFKRTGYSIGINFPPDWGEGYILSFKRGETRELRPNMTFHIPSLVKVFGFADAGTSETVRVTETGCEILTNFPRQLHVR
ncbi:Xaa-Pro peptidase family protein [Sinorhizobium sp. CCBAU 05631]|uniref:M24 family metallopeptidase n=1 Tax=Sinorhizobium sp. CCBAU 05631 TaxID=794846 RepID=UPI0004AD46C4|nr:Xaa-Pro peptidase family protein [Sinorhizobium sp. CCBAU 05631]ASY61095.1 putative dipeptidase [Sinorhizobium sp. CCBAU 05631]